MSSLFVLDTFGNQDLLAVDSAAKPRYEKSKQCKLLSSPTSLGLGEFVDELNSKNNKDEKIEEYDYFGLPSTSIDISNIIEDTLSISRKLPSKLEQKMDHVIQMADEAFNKKRQPKMRKMVDLDHSDFNEMTGKRDEMQTFKTNINTVLGDSDMVKNLEQLKELPSITKKIQKKLSRSERSKTKGKGWFNMPATELTEEVENDLKILQMRSVLDPKHFYKKNDLKVLPKYFQLGTVQHSHLDYYHERDTRRNKKRTLVDELLGDTEAQKYIKRKHKEIMITKQKYAHRKVMKKMKKLKQK